MILAVIELIFKMSDRVSGPRLPEKYFLKNNLVLKHYSIQQVIN